MKRTRSCKNRNPKIPLVKKTPQNDDVLLKSESDGRTSGNITSMHMETEINTQGLSNMIASIIKEITKESGGMGSLSRSLVNDSVINGQMAQPHVGNRSQLHQNPEYKQQELDAALAVIMKTMELDAAAPFNAPVDPVALEIPDYFDIVKTPMDFGTICNNLENGLKYLNSADVYKDVQYIWYNCLIYNKEGNHILKLMKRVKTFFTKHWKAARLQTEQSPAIIARSDAQPLAESSMLKHSKQQKENLLANNSHLQKNEASQSDQSSSQQESSPETDEPNIDSMDTQNKHQIHGLTYRQKSVMTVGRIKVLTNEMGQPIGPEALKLTRFLGRLSRDGKLAPLTYNGWSKMPAEIKENMWQKVLARFDIDPSCRNSVLLSLGNKWRSFKSQLKTARYDTHTTDEERLADRDERVLPDQWSFLVSQWSSDKFQRLSATNKANRAKVKFIHASGTKSFARLLEEEREKRPDGKELSQAELFILTRTRKNGQPVNEQTAAVISKLRESATPDETYHRVIADRKGGVPKPDVSAACETITPSRAEALKMVEEKDAEVVEMKERLASMEETCSQMSAQMSAMMSMMANMQKSFMGENIPNDVPRISVPVGRPNHSEPASTSNHEVPAKQTRGRKKRR